MKKYCSKFLVLVLVFALSVSLLSSVSISAKTGEETETIVDPVVTTGSDDYSPIAYYPVVSNKGKTFTGKNGSAIVANCYVQRYILTGFRDGIKKINKSIKKLAKSYDFSDLLSYAETAAEESNYKDVYSDIVTFGVTYEGSKYISFTSERYWYAGGVSNIIIQGYVYDLDTGKRKYITDVLGLSIKEIRAKLIEKIKNEEEFAEYVEEFGPQIEAFVNGLKAKDISFAINGNGNICILIPPYTEPLYGGWTREYVLEGVTVAE